MTTFPSRSSTGEEIRPSARSFSIGEYPIKSYKSLSGAVVKRSFGNRPFNYALELEFQAVSQSVMEAIFDHYHNRQGVTLGFALPNSLFSGMSSSVRSKLQTAGGGGSQWFYAEAPQIESLPNERSNVSVRLISEIPASLSIG